MRVMLLGATGTAGRAVLQELVNEDHEVVAPYRGSPPDISHNKLILLRKIENLDRETLARDAFKGEAFDALVTTLASRTGVYEDAWDVDYTANLEALHLARDAGARKVVVMSAICVQKPKLAFQDAKLALEEKVAASGLDYSIVRPTALFKSLSGQVERVRNGKPYLLFGNGCLTRCKPISDRDLARFMVGCLSDPGLSKRILPIGGPGPALTPREMGGELFRLTGKKEQFRSVPVALFSAIGGMLSLGGLVSKGLKTKAELARIGRYYATESMLVWDEEQGRYDAEATPEFGTDTLFDHYADLLRTGGSVDLKEHSVFKG